MNTSIKHDGIDSFWLKIIAIFGMTLDHISQIFNGLIPFPIDCIFNLLGGLTFPIMGFMIAEGYRHTRDVKKYMLRLLGFALVAQIPYMWAMWKIPNVLFTLLVGLVAIYLTEKFENKWLKALVVIAAIIVTANSDWGSIGPVMILLYHYGKRPWLNLILPILLSVTLSGSFYLQSLFAGVWQVLPMVLFIFGGGLLSILLLHQYNGQKGRSMRYLFYIYYPLHLLLLRLLLGLMTGDWGSIL